MDSGSEVYTPFPATVKCPPMAACVPSAFKNVPSSMLRSVSSSCRTAGLGLFCLAGKRLERATLCCLACLRMRAQVCLLSGALWTLLCCSGVSNATKPSTCVATAWAGWPCATRASCLVVPHVPSLVPPCNLRVFTWCWSRVSSGPMQIAPLWAFHAPATTSPPTWRTIAPRLACSGVLMAWVLPLILTKICMTGPGTVAVMVSWSPISCAHKVSAGARIRAPCRTSHLLTARSTPNCECGY